MKRLAGWTVAASLALLLSFGIANPSQSLEPLREAGYGRTAEGWMTLEGHVLQCSLAGWQKQELYYRHDLILLAEGCSVVINWENER